jgi:hypothetical protein
MPKSCSAGLRKRVIEALASGVSAVKWWYRQSRVEGSISRLEEHRTAAEFTELDAHKCSRLFPFIGPPLDAPATLKPPLQLTWRLKRDF